MKDKDCTEGRAARGSQHHFQKGKENLGAAAPQSHSPRPLLQHV